MLKQLIDNLLLECQRPENRKRLEESIIDPALCYILDRLYPYIFITAIIFVLLVILTIMLFIFLLKSK